MTLPNATNPSGVANEGAQAQSPEVGADNQDAETEIVSDDDAETENVDDDGDDSASDEDNGEEGGEGEETQTVEAEPETFEYEEGGVKHKVPAALKPALMRAADYTQKTQALAEAKKQHEAREQASRTHIREYASAINLDDQVKAYDNVDWDAWQQQDAPAADAAWRKLTLLKEQRQTAVNKFSTNERARVEEQQRETAKQLEEGRAALAKDIPNWSPTLAKSLSDYGVSKFGFTAEEIGSVTDPRIIKALHAAMQGEQKAKVAAKVKSLVAPQITKPVTQARSGSTQQTKDPARMTTAQYYEWRKKQPG